MNITLPPYLQPGDTIGITCPAGFASHERIAYSVQVLQRWGYKVRMGKTVGAKETYLSGTDDERLADLQSMLDDEEIKAILPGRGGYGTSRIIDRIDWTAFQKSPKWICGFSDITILHSHIHQHFNIATLHSPMCGAFKPETEFSYYIESFHHALRGKALSYQFTPSPANISGIAEGTLVGGNLALLAHLSGSCDQLDTDGKILFVEDIGEHYYQVDRMMLNLKRSGQLSGLKALLVGQFIEMEDTDRPFGYSVEEIILDKVAEFGYPVAFNFPCGHDTENVTLCLGQTHRLQVSADTSTLTLLQAGAPGLHTTA
jgi:muramoyltetrapeptide carboxypeptidase